MTHPLDPLSSDEFRAVAAVLHREHAVAAEPTTTSELGWRLASIELAEPGKDELRAFEADGVVPPRRATVVCLNRSANSTYKGVVSIDDGRVETFEHLPGVQANFTIDEFAECDRVLRTHPGVVEALAKRGITDLDNVFMDTWTYGAAVAPPEFRDRRLGWSDTWRKMRRAPTPMPIWSAVCTASSTSTAWRCSGSRTTAASKRRT